MTEFTHVAATERQVRNHYKARGCEVRIAQPEGHVRFRETSRGRRGPHDWREGGYITDYRVTPDGNVHKVT